MGQNLFFFLPTNVNQFLIFATFQLFYTFYLSFLNLYITEKMILFQHDSSFLFLIFLISYETLNRKRDCFRQKSGRL